MGVENFSPLSSYLGLSMDKIHENLAYPYPYPWNFRARIYPRILSMKKIQYPYPYPWNPWIYYIYRYYLQRESFNIRSFLIVPLLKDHLRKPRRSRPHMNLIIKCLVLVSRQWNSVRRNRAVLIGFIYKTLFRSGILLFLRHVTVSIDYSWILVTRAPARRCPGTRKKGRRLY